MGIMFHHGSVGWRSPMYECVFFFDPSSGRSCRRNHILHPLRPHEHTGDEEVEILALNHGDWLLLRYSLQDNFCESPFKLAKEVFQVLPPFATGRNQVVKVIAPKMTRSGRLCLSRFA